MYKLTASVHVDSFIEHKSACTCSYAASVPPEHKSAYQCVHSFQFLTEHKAIIYIHRFSSIWSKCLHVHIFMLDCAFEIPNCGPEMWLCP